MTACLLQSNFMFWLFFFFFMCFSSACCVHVISLSVFSCSASLLTYTETSIPALSFLLLLFLYSFRFPAQLVPLPFSHLSSVALRRVTQVLAKSWLSDEDRWNFFAASDFDMCPTALCDFICLTFTWGRGGPSIRMLKVYRMKQWCHPSAETNENSPLPSLLPHRLQELFHFVLFFNTYVRIFVFHQPFS